MVDFNLDNIYKDSLDKVVDFKFDEQTVGVFPDMINRSVPGYSTLISLSGMIAASCIEENDLVYDLGSSLGATTMSIVKHAEQRKFKLIAVDQSKPMLQKCQQLFPDHKKDSQPVIEWCHGDLNQMQLQSAKVITMNLVMQFIEPELRHQLLMKIYDALAPNGVFLLAEKVTTNISDSLNQQNILDEAHILFKKTNGYSELEIAQKRKALEKAMRIDSEAEHIKRLKEIGFSTVEPYFQALNFKGWIVKK